MCAISSRNSNRINRKQRKPTPNHRPCLERHRAITSRHSIVQIRHRRIRARLANPFRQPREHFRPRALARHGRTPYLPVILSPRVARIERDAEFLCNGGVEGRLHFVDGARDEGCVEEGVGVEVVEEAVGVGVVVGEGGVRRGGSAVDAEVLPVGDVGGGGVEIFRDVVRVGSEVCDAAHGADGNDAFEGEVSLVGEGAGEVVGALLGGGDEGIGDEVVGPLAQEGVVLGEVSGVAGFLRVREG